MNGAADYDVIVIGAGLSGLAAASLLAKSGLSVAIVDRNYCPGGSCGIFKRQDITFDQGSAMLYGFGEHGFNAHRFIFNCLEEPIDVIKHDLLYCVNYRGQRILFYPDLDQFTDELGRIFPSEKASIKRFYHDMGTLYQHVMVENPSYTTADETDPRSALRSIARHPVSYARFLSYLNIGAKSLLQRYFQDPGIFSFFDKLTSTYCYATLEEAPAILAAVMFVDNHAGGSFYPAGSTVFLPGRMEKSIEEHGGKMIMEKEVIRILFRDGKPQGVELAGGERLYAANLVYSGTVWNLYGKLIESRYLSAERQAWAAAQIPTFSSSVLYACVERSVIPDDTQPVEMLVGNPEQIDETEVTVYIFSIDDRTLCDASGHVIVAIGPSLEVWPQRGGPGYEELKEKERLRLVKILETRFPGFSAALRYSELATPRTIERYTMKNNGAVAGPKQMLGQHLFKRMHIRSEWDTLFCCGESTVMGTGTPTVTTSGISAANAILRKLGREPYVYQQDRKNYVHLVAKPFMPDDLYKEEPPEKQAIMKKAARCQLCEYPPCMKNTNLDIRGIMRRVMTGNFTGASRLAGQSPDAADASLLGDCQGQCIQQQASGQPVAILDVIRYLKQ